MESKCVEMYEQKNNARKQTHKNVRVAAPNALRKRSTESKRVNVRMQGRIAGNIARLQKEVLTCVSPCTLFSVVLLADFSRPDGIKTLNDLRLTSEDCIPPCICIWLRLCRRSIRRSGARHPSHKPSDCHERWIHAKSLQHMHNASFAKQLAHPVFSTHGSHLQFLPSATNGSSPNPNGGLHS